MATAIQPASTVSHFREAVNGLSGRLFSIAGVVFAVLLWYGVTARFENLRPFAPIDTFHALVQLFHSRRFGSGLVETCERMLGALALATIVGIPTGLAIGYFSWCRSLTYIPFQILRMVSPLSWTPVAIILFGVGSEPVYFLVAIAAVWPIILNTAAGVRAVEPIWIDAARCLGARNLQLLRFVSFRAALPHMVTGLQLATGVAWIVLVPAEMLGVASGLGYMILDFRDVGDYASIMALILVIGGLGLLLDWPYRIAARWAQWR